MKDSRLRRHLVDLLRGGQAYVTCEEALREVASALRTARPAPGTHSLWELLEHMRIAQEDILRYALDPQWRSPPWPEGYWPSGGEAVSEEDWEEARSRFLADREELVRLAGDEGRDLTAQIPHGEKGHTYLREILLAADHNAFHLGQIVQARKALGDWPPPE